MINIDKLQERLLCAERRYNEECLNVHTTEDEKNKSDQKKSYWEGRIKSYRQIAHDNEIKLG